MSVRNRPLSACAVALSAVLAAAAAPATAGEGQWTLRIEGVFTDLYGNDQHVLSVHEIDAAIAAHETTAAFLDTDSGVGYRTELQYTRGEWGLGLDFVWFKTNQLGPNRRGSAADASTPGRQLVYEIADRRYSSTGAGEILYYQTLEDTAVAMWTVDLYGIWTIAEGPQSCLRLLFGMRNADFDNDYRALVGIEDAVGTRVDASSNYDRMIGPMLGLAAELEIGRQRIEASFVQAVQIASVELTGLTRDYTGSSVDYSVEFGLEPPFDGEERFWTTTDVIIPVSELRLGWSYRISEIFAVGLAVDTAAWWDVPVPPGVIPGPGGNELLDENTLVFFGLAAALEMTF